MVLSEKWRGIESSLPLANAVLCYCRYLELLVPNDLTVSHNACEIIIKKKKLISVKIFMSNPSFKACNIYIYKWVYSWYLLSTDIKSILLNRICYSTSLTLFFSYSLSFRIFYPSSRETEARATIHIVYETLFAVVHYFSSVVLNILTLRQL